MVHPLGMVIRNAPDSRAHDLWLVRPALGFVLLTVLAALAGSLLLDVQRAWGLPPIDEAARSAVALHEHPALNRLMADITALGAEIPLLLAFCGLALWSYRKRGASWGRFFAVVLAGALALDNIVKPMVGRERPVFDQLVGGRGESFPSGHTTATTALLFALAYYLASAKSIRVRSCIWAAALFGSTLMGFSRVYLGVHWPTDVIAGLVLGATWTFLCARSQEILKVPVRRFLPSVLKADRPSGRRPIRQPPVEWGRGDRVGVEGPRELRPRSPPRRGESFDRAATHRG
jgi:membrane-associated phospholipid phosphatase